MRIGIVGSEAAKFTPDTERQARAFIRALLEPGVVVISGACHLGGVDSFAIEEAKAAGLEFREHKPRVLSWEDGYKPRNIRIAEDSDRVVCITVDRLPPTYTGMRFPLCYHCRTKDHVKSGGCWTVKYAQQVLGKPGEILVCRL
jgi:hypothetical protein